ncbi:MAG: proline dehydrogenase family protein [Chloroflexota bacterium]
MWRSVFLSLSTNGGVQHLATRSKIARAISSRFVAGNTLAEAVAATRVLNRRGVTVEMDYLGESVTDRMQAEVAADAYLEMLDGIAASGADSQLSLKPTQMGLAIDAELCYANIERIVERAAQQGNFVWMDIEDSPTIDRTLQIFERLRLRRPNVGIALQSYLYRTRKDVEDVLSVQGTVRLVKGAYSEPPEVAFSDKRDVDRSFRLRTERLLSSGIFHAIATHDEKMVQHAIDYAGSHGIPKEGFEFQMLYGVRRDLQEQLTRDGYRLRLYVPYGEQWYPYFMRRLAERPANLVFLLGNVAREVLPLH